jgi:hypothetical protein
MDLGRMILAALMMSSMETLPLCLMFFTFFLSRGGSFSAFITSAAADGTTVTCTIQNPRSILGLLAISVTTSPAALAAVQNQSGFYSNQPRGGGGYYDSQSRGGVGGFYRY